MKNSLLSYILRENPMTIEEILALTDKAQRIEYLKKGRRTEIPD